MDPDHIREIFETFGPVTVRRMFGGAGIYADGLMFALVADGVIYLKAGEDNAQAFDREGLPPFTYETRNGRRGVMSYRRMPDRLYDDPDELSQWAQAALNVARKASASKASASKGARTKAPARKPAAVKRRKTKAQA